MTHRAKTKKLRIPRIPFFKDERTISGLTTATAVRLFIISLVIAFVALCAGGWFLLDYVGKLANAQKQLSDVQKQLSEVQKNGRAARLADQRRTDREIENLQNDTRTTVCSIVALRPPGKSKALDLLSKHYKCPPYGKPVSSISSTSVEVSPAGSTGASGVASVPAVPSSGSPQPSVSPSGTSTPTPTARPSQTPLINLTSATCPLVGVFC